MFSLIFHRLKENRNLKYAAKVQPFIQITKFWKIILKVLYTQMPVPLTIAGEGTKKKNGLTKYQPVFCNFFQKIWKVQKLSLILQPVKC